MRIAASIGLMKLDCSGVTTENSAICVLVQIMYGDSVVFVTLIATFLSIKVDIEKEISKLVALVKLSSGVRVTCVPF